jgi:hypothetical protein
MITVIAAIAVTGGVTPVRNTRVGRRVSGMAGSTIIIARNAMATTIVIIMTAAATPVTATTVVAVTEFTTTVRQSAVDTSVLIFPGTDRI